MKLGLEVGSVSSRHQRNADYTATLALGVGGALETIILLGSATDGNTLARIDSHRTGTRR